MAGWPRDRTSQAKRASPSEHIPGNTVARFKPLLNTAELARIAARLEFEAQCAALDARLASINHELETIHAQQRAQAQRGRAIQSRREAALRGLLGGFAMGLRAIQAAAHDARPTLGLPELGGKRR